MHQKYIFSNIIGTFIFNEHFNLLNKKLFKNNEQKNKIEKEFEKKYKNMVRPEGKELEKTLSFFKNKEFFNDFHKNNLELTKIAIKESVKDDILIIQAINNIQEIDKSVNILIKRLREWYALNNPEFEYLVENQEKFIELILKKQTKKEKDSMGADLSKEDLEPIMSLAKQVDGLFQLRKEQEIYLNKMMEKTCPNLLAIAGSTIGAKLIEQSGSLKNLMEFPASTIQLLGAEKALFRHMKTGARTPKYGFLHEHPLISQNPRNLHGKIARTLADKISLAVKVDYFKGKFIGDKLLKQVEDKFSKKDTIIKQGI